jgi:hypothetical protein
MREIKVIKKAIPAFILIVAAPVLAYASEQIPVSVGQTYLDGTATELACKADSPCTFTVQGKHPLKLSLERSYFGYSISWPLTVYWYWPNSGYDLSLSVEVECQEKDLALVTDPNSTCRIFLTRDGAGFIAEHVAVQPLDSYPRFRELGTAP